MRRGKPGIYFGLLRVVVWEVMEGLRVQSAERISVDQLVTIASEL